MSALINSTMNTSLCIGQLVWLTTHSVVKCNCIRSIMQLLGPDLTISVPLRAVPVTNPVSTFACVVTITHAVICIIIVQLDVWYSYCHAA